MGIFKKRVIENAFELVGEGKAFTFTLENQDEKIEALSEADVLAYLKIMLADAGQFVILEAPEPIGKVRYIQAALTDGQVEVEAGVEKNYTTHLYYKMYSEQECVEIFKNFFNYKIAPDLRDYKPVEFE